MNPQKNLSIIKPIYWYGINKVILKSFFSSSTAQVYIFLYFKAFHFLLQLNYNSDVMSLQERARNTRSHSLKPLGQPSLLTQRSKRTLSLPAKPVIPPLINIQRYHDNWESNSDEDEPICDTPEEESMGEWLPFRVVNICISSVQ